MLRENLFKIDINSDKLIEAEEFILRSEGEELTTKRQALDDRMNALLKRTIQKGMLVMIPLVLLMIGIVCAVFSFRTFLEVNKLSPIPTVAALIFLVLALLAYLWYRKQTKTNDIDAEIEQINQQYADLNELSKKELCVPRDARTVEIFTDLFSLSGDKEDNVYTNDEVCVFRENEMLCIYYGSAVIGVPMSDLEAIVKSEEQISFDTWEKDTPYNEGVYSQYNIEEIKVDDLDEHYTMTGYYKVQFTHAEKPFEMIVPPYDIAPMLELLRDVKRL